MPRKTYIPRKDEHGNYRMVEVATRPEHGRAVIAEDFKTRIRSTLYHLECRDGSRFKIPGCTTQELKRAWTH